MDFISSVNHKDGCWMQGVNSGQTGPNLSLSSLGGQLGLSHQPGGRGQPVSNQMFSGMDSAVPWLSRSNNLGRSDLRSDGLTQVVGRSGGMNLQHHMATDSKSGITSASANSPSSQVIDLIQYEQHAPVTLCPSSARSTLCTQHTGKIAILSK